MSLSLFLCSFFFVSLFHLSVVFLCFFLHYFFFLFFFLSFFLLLSYLRTFSLPSYLTISLPSFLLCLIPSSFLPPVPPQSPFLLSFQPPPSLLSPSSSFLPLYILLPTSFLNLPYPFYLFLLPFYTLLPLFLSSVLEIQILQNLIETWSKTGIWSITAI